MPSQAALSRSNTLQAAVSALLLALGCLPAWALRLPEPAASYPVHIYTLWNSEYLCFAAKVSDPMVTGSSTGPMSTPQQDDAIEFDLEIPSPTDRQAHRLIISAAGGMTLFTRTPRGQWRTDPSWTSAPPTLKYAVIVNGTRDNPSDQDIGFTVECAIPWKFLGGRPAVGAQLGFNAACWTQGESEGFVSWSQMVATEADIGDSARWGRLLIAPSASVVTPQGNLLPCPVANVMPFIDGKLEAQEWLAASTLTIEKPKLALAPAPRPGKQAAVASTLLAIYRYDWQGDPRRPGAPFWLPDGRPATADQPKEAPGPWYSYERVPWHGAQLEQIQRAGIDVILARYRGDDHSRRTWARTGLDRLSEALKGMRAEGRGYPLVGMMLDTAALQGLDLKSEQGKAALYGMVQEFFLHVPREFWAEVGARPREGVRGGAPVLLGEPAGLADWDGSFLGYAQERFARDFSGAKLIWLGSSQWRSRGAEGFYAYVRLPRGATFSQEGVGGVSAVALAPGYCPPPGAEGQIRPRREGRSYRADWQRVLAAGPELVVLDSWNDFEYGTELAPSRQYGFTYADLTRYFAARIGSGRPQQLRLKKQSAPEVLLPGVDYRAELLVENTGTEDFASGRRTTVDHRVVRLADGKVMRSKIGAQDLSIMAGQTLRLPVVISTKDEKGQPLPPGQYLFSLVAVKSRVAYLRSRWFAQPAAELTVPITVGQPPAHRATIVSTSLPSSIEAGAAENVVVRLRNDGTQTWRAATTSLSYHWLRHEDDLSGGTSERTVAEGARASLPRDVAPGQIASVMIRVSAANPDGTPLAPARPEDLWHYRVQWDLVEGDDGWFSGRGSPATSEPIAVVPRDRGVLFASAGTPTVMEAGQGAQVEVVVGNAGPRAWAAGDLRVVPRWYRWDGRALSGSSDGSALPEDVAPDTKVKLTVPLTAPETPGPYWLAWEMAARGEELAPADGGQRADLLVAPVMVKGGRFQALDLSKLTNVVAITDDAHRGRGDFDGQGRALPAEWLPPDATGAADRVYPSGYYCPSPASGVPFAFPDISSGLGAAVGCDGQSLELGERGAKRLHLLLASVGQQEEVAFTLQLDSGATEQVQVSVPGWTEGPQGRPGEVGAYAPYLRTLTQDEGSASACLYHRVLAPSSGLVVSVQLPKEPTVRILAVTAEGE